MKTKILIVDDELGILEEVKDYLTEEGFDVYTADIGKDGIDQLKKVMPDILLLDMKLPDMSGIDVLRECKKFSPRTKVIVNTGYVDQKLIDEAEELGRDIFIQKPFDLEYLKTQIDSLIQK